MVDPSPHADDHGVDDGLRPGVDADGGIDTELLEQLTRDVRMRAEALRLRMRATTDRDVRIVAVTKGHPPEAAMAARAAGFEDLAENYAQELLTKTHVVPGVRWHFVGSLQTNKVRKLADEIHLWQSVDRPALVRELAKRAPGAHVLVQADLAGTEGRGGAPRDQVAQLVGEAGDAALVVEGLMGVAPPDPHLAAEAFSWLADTARSLGLEELSMGMSGDLEQALAAGATMVRVGSALFGQRPAGPQR